MTVLVRMAAFCCRHVHCEPLQLLTLAACCHLQFGSVDDVLAVYAHQQQLYGFASTGVQTTLIHALLKAHGRGQPGNLLAYEAWRGMRAGGRLLDAQALLAGGVGWRGVGLGGPGRAMWHRLQLPGPCCCACLTTDVGKR